jgi:hypothetical protein
MKEQLLNLPEDITWLFDTHLADYPLWYPRTKAFILYGNDDCPEMVDLYEQETPIITDQPFIRHTF